MSLIITKCLQLSQCCTECWILFVPSCRQSACHWNRPYRQSLTRIRLSKSANCESAHRVESLWKGVSWAAVSFRSSSTSWLPRDTPLKSSSSSPPSLVEMWVLQISWYLTFSPQWNRATVCPGILLWGSNTAQLFTSFLSPLVLCCWFVIVLYPHKQRLNWLHCTRVAAGWEGCLASAHIPAGEIHSCNWLFCFGHGWSPGDGYGVESSRGDGEGNLLSMIGLIFFSPLSSFLICRPGAGVSPALFTRTCHGAS